MFSTRELKATKDLCECKTADILNKEEFTATDLSDLCTLAQLRDAAEKKLEAQAPKARVMNKWNIGDQVVDEDGNRGIVVIRWNDGDICEYENDAAHPNPTLALKGGRDEQILCDTRMGRRR
jgi:hypothetical protein